MGLDYIPRFMGERAVDNSPKTTFWRHCRLVLGRAFDDFGLGRDMALGAALAVATTGLQVFWKLISEQDWNLNKWRWIASVVLPFVVVIALHIAYRLLTAPWRVHQQQESENWNTTQSLVAVEESLRTQIEQLKRKVGKLTWPEDRPRLTFQGWGWIHPPEGRTHSGIYLANHGSTALEVSLETINVGSLRTTGSTTDHICQNDAKAVEVWLDGEPEVQKWCLDNYLDGCWNQAKKSDTLPESKALILPISVVYRDFNNLWYRTRGELSFKFVSGMPDGVIDFKTLEQEQLGDERPLLT
jgi:hypothetical protein